MRRLLAPRGSLLLAADRPPPDDPARPSLITSRVVLAGVFALLLVACEPYQNAPMTNDPCGGEPGKARYSYAWVNSELVREGHPKAWVCHNFSSSAAAAYHRSLDPAAAEHFSRFLRDKLRVVRIGYDAQKAEAKRLGKEAEFDAIWGTPPPGG